MTKTLTALALAATVAIGAIAVPTAADARGWHRGWGHHGWGYRGWGPGAVVGGLAAGAIMAGAAGAYGPYYGYPAYAYGPGCVIRNRRVWNGWAWRWRPVRICY